MAVFLFRVELDEAIDARIALLAVSTPQRRPPPREARHIVELAASAVLFFSFQALSEVPWALDREADAILAGKLAEVWVPVGDHHRKLQANVARRRRRRGCGGGQAHGGGVPSSSGGCQLQV